MKTVKYLLTKILVAYLFISCSTYQNFGANVVYFSKFDIFKLAGSDTIALSKVDYGGNSEYIKVSYIDKLPNIITYYYPSRTVVLTQDTMFRFDNHDIYVHSTDNLLGGKPGKQRDYSFHNIDNGYKLFIDLSDTIIVKSFDKIDIKSGDSYHYMVDVYTKEKNQFSRYSLLQDETSTALGEDSLYSYWSPELNTFKPNVISNVVSFPPR